jgi:hypothetical protein
VRACLVCRIELEPADDTRSIGLALARRPANSPGAQRAHELARSLDSLVGILLKTSHADILELFGDGPLGCDLGRARQNFISSLIEESETGRLSLDWNLIVISILTGGAENAA